MNNDPREALPIEHQLRLVAPAPARSRWLVISLTAFVLLTCVVLAARFIEPGWEQFACSRCSAERDGVYVTIARREIYASSTIYQTPLSHWLSAKLGPCQHQWRFHGRQTLWVRYCGKAPPTLELNYLLEADSPDLPLMAWLDREQSADPSLAQRLSAAIGGAYHPKDGILVELPARLIEEVVLPKQRSASINSRP